MMEWFRNFYQHRKKGGAAAPVEFVSRPGDLVFVPRGWWHIALNISDEPTIAITQNLCSPCSLTHVLDFLRLKPGQVRVCALARHRVRACNQPRHATPRFLASSASGGQACTSAWWTR